MTPFPILISFIVIFNLSLPDAGASPQGPWIPELHEGCTGELISEPRFRRGKIE